MICFAKTYRLRSPLPPCGKRSRWRIKRWNRRLSVLQRDGFKCVYCGRDFLGSPDAMLLASLDHVQPRAAGGANAPANTVANCIVCNQLKAGTAVTTVRQGRRLVEARRRSKAVMLAHALTRIGVACPWAPRPSLARRIAAAVARGLGRRGGAAC